MTPEHRERLDAISSALARLVRRQSDLEQRLARLESALHLRLPDSPPEPPPAEPVLSPATASPPPALSNPPPAPKPASLETAFGLTWLSRVGVITVVLALAFFFEYAFQNHWITEWGRILLGVVCGAAALLFGERLWRGSQRTFAQALTGAGIAFLYLSFWAAFALYHLIAQPAAFGLMLLVTAGAGALAVRYQGSAIAVLGLAGGYATPLLLESQRDVWFVFSYTLLLNLGAAAAARARGWRWLEALALAGTVVLYTTQMQFPPPPGLRWLYTIFICVYYTQFVVAPVPPVSIAAQVLAGLTLVQIWTPGSGVLWLLLAAAVTGLTVAERRNWPAAVSASFLGFWVAYAWWHGDRPSGSVAAPLAAITAAFVVFLGWPVWRARYDNRTLRFQELVVLALNAAFYFGAGYALLENRYQSYAGVFAIFAALLAAGAARLLWDREPRAGLLTAGIAATLLVLAAPIQLVGYRVTLAWALEAAAITWIAVRMRKPAALYAAAGVFLLVLLRLAFVNTGMYPLAGSYRELANARFLVFAVAAASFWAAALWARQEPRFALPAYVAGHAVLLWGLGLEVAGWAERTTVPENLRSVLSASLSVLAAAYAVLLVAAGLFQRDALTRVLGVVLIGLVVLKLYLYDVWLLGQFYRMAAFAILGVLLLLMSYFYSRFRRSLENWWRP